MVTTVTIEAATTVGTTTTPPTIGGREHVRAEEVNRNAKKEVSPYNCVHIIYILRKKNAIYVIYLNETETKKNLITCKSQPKTKKKSNKKIIFNTHTIHPKHSLIFDQSRMSLFFTPHPLFTFRAL